MKNNWNRKQHRGHQACNAENLASEALGRSYDTVTKVAEGGNFESEGGNPIEMEGSYGATGMI